MEGQGQTKKTHGKFDAAHDTRYLFSNSGFSTFFFGGPCKGGGDSLERQKKKNLKKSGNVEDVDEDYV